MKVDFNPDGTIKGLPWQLELSNAMMCAAYPILLVAAAQWLHKTRQASKDGKFRWPHTVRGFNYLTGVSCADILSQVWQFGIPTQHFLLQFELWPDRKGIGLVFSFWVPATQAAMADDILRQSMSNYVIDGPRIGTGAKFTRPWGVEASARSFDQWMLMALHNIIGSRLKIKNAKGKEIVQKQPSTPVKGRRK